MNVETQIHDCIIYVIDLNDPQPPKDAYARRMWKFARFARAYGASDKAILEAVARDIKKHPLADEQTVARVFWDTMRRTL